MVKVRVEETKGNFIETTTVPEGSYIAVLEAIKEGTLKFQDEERPVFRWFFRVIDRQIETEDGQRIYPVVEGITSQRFTPRSNAYKWWSTLMGHKPAVGEEVELEDAIGHVVQIVVKNKTSKNGRTYSRATEVVPVPEGMKKFAEQLLENYQRDTELVEEEEVTNAVPEEEEGEEEENDEVEELIIPKKPKKVKKVKKG